MKKDNILFILRKLANKWNEVCDSTHLEILNKKWINAVTKQNTRHTAGHTIPLHSRLLTT